MSATADDVGPTAVPAARVSGPGVLAELVQLFEAEYEPMMRLAFLLTGDRHDAEEIVQEAFLDVQHRWSGLLNPGGFLRAAVVNGARRRGRRERRRREIVVEHGPTLAATCVDDVYDHTFEMVQRLPDHQRVAVVLAYYVGLDSVAVASTMGCRPSTARSHVRRALRRLRKEMER